MCKEFAAFNQTILLEGSRVYVYAIAKNQNQIENDRREENENSETDSKIY